MDGTSQEIMSKEVLELARKRLGASEDLEIPYDVSL